MSAPAAPSREDNGGNLKDNGNVSKYQSLPASEERKWIEGTMSPLKKDCSRTAEQVLLGDISSAATIDDLSRTPEVLEDPPKRKSTQLSSFKPSKDNLQQRPDGVAVLRFSDDEVLPSFTV